MVINKQLTATATASITLTNFLPAGTAQAWQLTSANAITRLGNISFAGYRFTHTVPAQSVTLFVLPAGVALTLRAGGMSSSNTFNFWLDGPVGARCAILSSGNLVNWSPIQTNTIETGPLQIVVPATNAVRFYRAQRLP
jgi:hypothetical protein